MPSAHSSAETFCSELKRQCYHGTNSNNIQSCWISRKIPGEDYSLLSSLRHSLLHGTSCIIAANAVSKARQTHVKPSLPSFRLFQNILNITNSFKFSTRQMSLEHGCSYNKSFIFPVNYNQPESKLSDSVSTPLLPSWRKLADQNWCRYQGDLNPLKIWDPKVNIIKRRERGHEN